MASESASNFFGIDEARDCTAREPRARVDERAQADKAARDGLADAVTHQMRRPTTH